jgi:hypothetical protein
LPLLNHNSSLPILSVLLDGADIIARVTLSARTSVFVYNYFFMCLSSPSYSKANVVSVTKQTVILISPSSCE